MIEYSSVMRLSDGMPLTASNDETRHQSLSNVKKVMKQFLHNLSELPKRVSLLDDNYTIHCVHSPVVAFMSVCDPTFSHLMAFSFLEEISKEFNMLYTASVVAAVRRPYAFTEFDSYMQKLRQQFNKPVTPVILANRHNLSQLRSELTLQPPATLNISSLSMPPSNAVASSHMSINIPNGTVHSSTSKADDTLFVGIAVRQTPISYLTYFTECVVVFLSFLSMYRFINSVHHTPIEEHGKMIFNTHIYGYLLENFMFYFQMYLLNFYYRIRKVLSILSLVIIALNAAFVLSPLREAWLSIFIFLLSLKLTHATVTRTFRKIKTKFNV